MESRRTRIKQLLEQIHHVAIATINADGTPHNTPVFAAFDEQLNVFWSSHPESLHSQNLTRTGRAFIVLFDSREGHGGLYLETQASELHDAAGIAHAHRHLQALKQRLGGSMGEAEHYRNGGPRLYRATPIKIWTNHSQRDQAGVIISDRREEIPPGSL